MYRSSRSWTTRCGRAGRASSAWSCGSGATSRSRCPARATSRGPSSWPGRPDRVGRLGAARSERTGLHPRHVGHDGEAEARHSHPRRLPGAHLQHGPVVLRPQADRRLVVDVRHRLDRRPQLHRLRAAPDRLHDRGVRRRARFPAGRDQLAHRGRGIRRHRHLHLADRRPHVDALRRRPASERRLHAPRARVLRRRGAQPAGLGLAAEHRSRRADPGHRSHVADRDERSGVRQSVRPRDDADQARLGDDCPSRHRRRRRRPRRPALRRR